MAVEKLPLLSERGADIKGCYRYRLWRVWDSTKPWMTWVLLNPSTADETHDDATLRRCVGFAKSWSYGAVLLVNAFTFRATRPRDLHNALDPIGPENNTYIVEAARSAEKVVVAWGGGAKLHNRDQEVLVLLQQTGKSLFCLGQNKDGSPRHPLYLPEDALLLPYPN